MITFAPTLARRQVPGLRFATQFEYIGSRVYKAGFWTRAVRKVLAQYLALCQRPSDYLYGTLLHESDRVIALSETHKAHLLEHAPSLGANCLMIPPPPIMAVSGDDPADAGSRGRRLLGVQPNEFLLVFYGYLYPGKGIETLLRALALVRSQHPAIRLAIVGGPLQHSHGAEQSASSEAYIESLHALAAELRIQEQLIWAGPCESTSPNASLSFHAADACVFPFDAGVHLNNSSIVAAIAHHRPIITTKGLDTESAFAHGHNVLLCEPANVEALATTICELIDDDALRLRLRAGTAAMSAEWFSWDAAVAQTLAALAAPAQPQANRALVTPIGIASS
jgi:glycosyltransferase involved in cell wall biosynthesis